MSVELLLATAESQAIVVLKDVRRCAFVIGPARIVLGTGLERLAASGDRGLLLLDDDLLVSVCWSVVF